VGIIYSQDSDHLLIDNEPEVQVILTVDTHPKSDIDVIKSESFTCHECTNCNQKSDITTRICESDINMCYVNLF
jgi:hypothetical protein